MFDQWLFSTSGLSREGESGEDDKEGKNGKGSVVLHLSPVQQVVNNTEQFDGK